MARLNEPPVSMDTLETLRRKMLRQNRDLAKSNNVKALRIRELENECASMLSENLEIRGRVLELEKQVEDSDSRRIADHAMAIKAKLESQLTEWGTLLAGLGLEPPMKKHSPHIRRISKPRMSFGSNRPSPSQRRLRDISRDIEELGHISEHKSTARMSMNHEQILALRSEADSTSPELGPPPVSKFIESEPVKVDSPTRASPVRQLELSPERKIAPPVALPSPKPAKQAEKPASPEKKREPVVQKQETKSSMTAPTDTSAAQPIKTGSKRKLSARDETESARINRITDENRPPRVMAEKTSIREKAGGKTLKELASMRKEARDRPIATSHPRKALAAKSTNNDPTSPKKASKPTMGDDIAAAKADLAKSKAAQDRAKPKTKNRPAVKIEAVSSPDMIPPATATVTCDLVTPLLESALLSPSSPEPVSSGDGPRGDTPPPADITSTGETTRPSRRNKAAISYAEPNLRDKMRRPSKQLFDAVTGEGKYSRRSSVFEPLAPDSALVKRESDAGESWKRMPAASVSAENEPGVVPASPLAGKGPSHDNLPSSVATERRRRPSAAATRLSEATLGETKRDADSSYDDEANGDDGEGGDIDPYEFTSSSPRTDKAASKKKAGSRQSKSTRRFSAAVDDEGGVEVKERNASRRRSMML